jgi:hypothetical protein
MLVECASCTTRTKVQASHAGARAAGEKRRSKRSKRLDERRCEKSERRREE